jgi:hypothetical protein
MGAQTSHPPYEYHSAAAMDYQVIASGSEDDVPHIAPNQPSTSPARRAEPSSAGAIVYTSPRPVPRPSLPTLEGSSDAPEVPRNPRKRLRLARAAPTDVPSPKKVVIAGGQGLVDLPLAQPPPTRNAVDETFQYCKFGALSLSSEHPSDIAGA